jgi:exonuclease III
MDQYNMLSWNVRGLNMRARCDALRVLVGDIRPAILCVQETKLVVITKCLLNSFLGAQYNEFTYPPVSDTRGGILIAGRRSLLTFSNPHVGCFSITVKVTHVDSHIVWWLTSVYGPQADGDKALFLDDLEAIRDACPGPWAVVGDFNLILDVADKNNARVNRRNMTMFRRVVDRLELCDMHLHGRLYTWSNERANLTLVKLDRLLASLDWEELFPYCYLEALSYDISDHCPILMHSNASMVKSKPRFHFEIFWPKFDDYIEAVQRGWRCPSSVTDPCKRLDCLLRDVAKGVTELGVQKDWKC